MTVRARYFEADRTGYATMMRPPLEVASTTRADGRSDERATAPAAILRPSDPNVECDLAPCQARLPCPQRHRGDTALSPASHPIASQLVLRWCGHVRRGIGARRSRDNRLVRILRATFDGPHRQAPRRYLQAVGWRARFGRAGVGVTVFALVIALSFVVAAAFRGQFGWLSVPVVVGLLVLFSWDPARAAIRRIRPSRSER